MAEARRNVDGLVIALDVPTESAAQLVRDLVRQPTVVDATAEPADTIDAKWSTSTWDVIAAVARDVGSLRRAAALFDSFGTAPTVAIHLVERPVTSPPQHRGVVLAQATRVVTSANADGSFRVCVEAAEPQRPRPVVASVALPGTMTRPSGLRVTAADHAALQWCVDEPDAQTLAVTRRIGGSSEIAPDVLVTTSPAREETLDAHVVADVSQRCAPVDTVAVNPREFPIQFGGQARVESVGDGVALRLTDGPLVGDPSGRLSAADLALLRGLRHVRLENAAERNLPPVPLATLLVHLAAGGVPTITHWLPPEVSALMHPDLVSELESARPVETSEELTRERVSVRQRRAALRRHGLSGSWDRLRADLGLAAGIATSTSVLLLTRRPYFLDHALHAMKAQQNADMEVVLVTHGFALDKGEQRKWREQCGHPLTVLDVPDDLPLGAALNLAVTACSGDVVTKMDDDDWYGPHHVEDVTQALAWSGATVVGVQALYTYLVDLDLTVRGPDSGIRETTGRRVPGPTMTFRKADLLHLGGFRPLPRFEDLSISLALKRMGGTVHLTHGLGFLRCRHGTGHSWAAGTAHFLRGTTNQWRGFRPPPEIVDDEEAQRHLDDVRRRSGDIAPLTVR